MRDLCKSLLSTASTDDSDCLNNLTSKLFVFWLIKLAKITNKEIDSFFKVRDETFSCFFNYCSKRRWSIFFYDWNTVFNHEAEFLRNHLQMRNNHLFSCILKEICHSSTSMWLHSWHWVIKRVNKRWDNRCVECFLELFWHIVWNLSNTMKCSMSDLRICMVKMCFKNWYHSRNFSRLVDIFANLWKRKDTSIFKSPVRFVSNSILN